MKKDKVLDIPVFDGDDGIKYIRYDDMLNILEQIRKNNKERDIEIEKLNSIINELEKDLYKIRELTFNKYNSNEWNNCLSFNEDILPVINRLKELKGDDSNENNNI